MTVRKITKKKMSPWTVIQIKITKMFPIIKIQFIFNELKYNLFKYFSKSYNKFQAVLRIIVSVELG